MNESNASSGSIKPQVELPKCTDCTHPIAYHGLHGCRLCKCTAVWAAAEYRKATMLPVYNAKYTQGDDLIWFVEIAEVQAHTQGKTIAEARERIREALSAWLTDKEEAVEIIDHVMFRPQVQSLIYDAPMSVEASGVHLARAMQGTTFHNGTMHEVAVSTDDYVAENKRLCADRDTWKKLAEDADEKVKDLEEKLARKPVVKTLEDGEIELWSDDHAHRFSPTFKVNYQLEIIDKLEKAQLLRSAHVADLEAKLAARPVPIQLNDGAEIAKLEARIRELEHDAMTFRRRGTP